jgi:hypothetical protein
LLCFLSSVYPKWAIMFQSLIALDFASHYIHMYRYDIYIYIHSFPSLFVPDIRHEGLLIIISLM